MNFRNCAFRMLAWFLTSSVLTSAQVDVSKLHSTVMHLRDDVLGISKFQDYVNNRIKLKTVSLNPGKIVRNVSNAIGLKFQERISAVYELNDAVIGTYSRLDQWGSWDECCKMKTDNLKKNDKYLRKVDTSIVCNVVSYNATEVHKIPSNAFLLVAQENQKKYSGLKWQYFGSDTGVLSQYPASKSCLTSYDNRFRPWYVQASAPKPRDLVLVIDHSSSMFKYGRMNAAIEAAITVLNTLNPNDRVAVVSFSDDANIIGPSTEDSGMFSSVRHSIDLSHTSCFKYIMASATPRNIHHLIEKVKEIVPKGNSYYVTGLKVAFDFLLEAYNRDYEAQKKFSSKDVSRSRDRVVLFLSDGLPSEAPAKIFKFIQVRNVEMRNSVVLLCFGLGNGTFGSVLHQMSSQKFNFHANVDYAAQQCTKNGICDIPPPIPGVFHQVTHASHLRSAMGSYYSFFSSHSKNSTTNKLTTKSIVISVPYFDASGLGMVLTVASPVIVYGKLVGVVGIDLSLHDLMLDMTYFRTEASHAAYLFLMDLAGRVYIHPFLPSPHTVNSDPTIAYIDVFERTNNVQKFLYKTLHSVASNVGPTGLPLQKHDLFTGEFLTNRVYPTAHKGVFTNEVVSEYTCAKVSYTEFVFCFVVDRNYKAMAMLQNQPIPTGFHFKFHNLSVLDSQHMCEYQSRAVIFNMSAVMLSPSTFINVGQYMELLENQQLEIIAKRCMFGELADCVIFKDGVRNSVLASFAMEKIWLNSHYNVTSFNGLADRVLWRYFGSENGVFRIFPAVKMPKWFDPASRPWYETAHGLILEKFAHFMAKDLDNSKQRIYGDSMVAVSAPYSDANGGGLVVTVSGAITLPLPNLGSMNDRPPHIFGVMGADIHLSYIHDILHKEVPTCKNSALECIIIDTSGFVVYDYHLVNKEGRASHFASRSNYHLIHSNAPAAAVLIDKGILVQQKCAFVHTVSARTNYHINLERLYKTANLPFQIYHVPGTNILLLIFPYDFQTQQACTVHTDKTEKCRDSRPSPRINMLCESPCVEYSGVLHSYSTCFNRFNFTRSDPPPCSPQHFDKAALGSKVSGNVQDEILGMKSLPVCRKN